MGIDGYNPLCLIHSVLIADNVKNGGTSKTRVSERLWSAGKTAGKKVQRDLHPITTTVNER